MQMKILHTDLSNSDKQDKCRIDPWWHSEKKKKMQLATSESSLLHSTKPFSEHKQHH